MSTQAVGLPSIDFLELSLHGYENLNLSDTINIFNYWNLNQHNQPNIIRHLSNKWEGARDNIMPMTWETEIANSFYRFNCPKPPKPQVVPNPFK